MTDRMSRARSTCLLAAICLALVSATFPVASAEAAVKAPANTPIQKAQATEQGASSLEDAAARAGTTGRAVAMSLIGLALAVAATVLAFRRDFKEAAGVLAVGLVAVLLATPSGVNLLRDTVASLLGSQ
jgi:hypothetical protein